MKTTPKGPTIHEAQISLGDFVASYNQMIPETWPHATAELLEKFKESNTSLFKHGDSWSIDLHRKRIIDWLPLNSKVAQD
jgi:hypothetical protein